MNMTKIIQSDGVTINGVTIKQTMYGKRKGTTIYVNAAGGDLAGAKGYILGSEQKQYPDISVQSKYRGPIATIEEGTNSRIPFIEEQAEQYKNLEDDYVATFEKPKIPSKGVSSFDKFEVQDNGFVL